MKRTILNKFMVFGALLLFVGVLLANKNVVNAASNPNDFIISGKMLKGYTGNGGDIEIPAGISIIGENAFKDNVKITKVTFPISMVEIESEAFYGCTGLKEVVLNNGLKQINERAFYGCTGLTEITIPTTVVDIYQQAFSHCSSLTKINVAEGSKNFNSVEGVLFQNNKLVAYPGNKKGAYTIPDIATSCAYYAFEGCIGLTEVTLHRQWKNVEEGVFKDCINLTKINFSNGMTSIDSNAFEGCIGLVEINMPNTLQRIGDEAFKGCTGVNKISIQTRVTYIGEGAFSGCSKLESFTIKKANTRYSAKNGVLYNKKYTEILLYPAGKTGSVKFLPSVNAIGANAFTGSQTITTIDIPDRIKKIGAGAFKDCVKLQNIKFSSSITSIPSETFQNCIALKKVEIPGYVKSIKTNAFAGCLNIKKMVIPQSMTSINRKAFEDCDELIVYGDKNSYAEKFATRNSYGFIPTTTKPARLVLAAKSPAKGQAKISWKKAAKASSYIIQVSTKKSSGYKTLATVKSVGYTKGGFVGGKKYYFRARASKVVNKKTHYGAYSEPVSVKIKK